jgi:hypothetical protein
MANGCLARHERSAGSGVQLPTRLFREGPPQGDAKARPAPARSFDHAPRFRLSLSSLALGKQKETIDASLWFR